MKKKRSPVSNPRPHNGVPNSRSVRGRDLWLYARSFHKAAKKLAGMLEVDSGPFPESDACPVVFMYRHALELHLKALVLGEGGNFLVAKPDALSVHKTHSVSWLAQFVSQIITAVKWEEEFQCEGVGSLADFKATIEEVNAVDPGSYTFQFPISADQPGSARSTTVVREFARRMDALLELLDSTADALAATWDMQTEAATQDSGLDGWNDPTIH